MTSNARRAAVLEEVLRAALEGDAQAIARLCTEDVKVWTPDRAIFSREELVEQLGRHEQAFSSTDGEIVPLDVGGDYACAEWSVTLTHIGKIELADGSVIDPTGANVRVHGATVAEFSGGQVCALRQYWDELGALQQITAAAAPPADHTSDPTP